MALKRLAIRISGRVHGVGFRFFSRDLSERLGLTGWVRNTPPRIVEMEVQGEATALDVFCERVKQGPRLAHVGDVEISEITVQVSETSFDIFH
jgi:acylphosphatase